MTATVPRTLSEADTQVLNCYWRAANYLSVGQIYLMDNPLLTEPLRPEHIKPRLLGHWGTSPGLNFMWAHLNRAVLVHDQPMMYVIGPGHGGPAALANTWLDGTYSDVYPSVSQDAAGLRALFRQFSFPGGVPSHVAPQTPGSIHEGGELGYSLSHAHGAAFDNPGLIVACIVGDGESETGPLATSWHAHRFLDPARDGAVLPILHLNGWKIANPAVLARIPESELDSLLRGYGYEPRYVTGHEPSVMHQAMAAAVDDCIAAIRDDWIAARGASGVRDGSRPRWPMIVLRSPKGWTGPKVVDGLPVEGTWRSHQVPLAEVRTNPQHLRQLEDWMRSYRPEELFDSEGRPRQDLLGLVPAGDRRLGASPHANGGVLLRDLVLPDFRDYAVQVTAPGVQSSEPTRVLGGMLRDVMKRNIEHRNFRLFGPDETESNRLNAVLDVTGKTWEERVIDVDQHLAADGRVMEILSEHTCQGWLEGYLLTGRHGLFSCYEAFAHIVDSMFNQHAKFLETSRKLSWRRPVASLNYLLTSHVWRQDHNGFTHQDPGFIDLVMNKKPEVIRVYLPPDANTLLSVADHCLRSRDYVNVIVSGKQPSLDWLDMDSAILHCTRGAGIWEWASSDGPGQEPDVVMACAGDIPALEVLAATDLLRRHLAALRVRVVNVVDLMRLQPEAEHPHGMSDAEFDALFTTDRPVIFAYHGYPWLIHRFTYNRTGHSNIHVRGYKEEGTTTTPFDMVVMNDMDRFHLVMDVIDRVPGLANSAAWLRQQMVDTRARHHAWVREHGEDLPEVAGDLGIRGCSHDPMTSILVVNAGSSSLKLSVLSPADEITAARSVDRWDGSPDHPEVAEFLRGQPGIGAVGHRVVHGGSQFTRATVIDDAVVRAIGELADLAPLHQPRAVAGIRATRAALPGAAQVACFDTAFHAGIPPAAATYALPAAWNERYGLRRYGFHGLSHQYASQRCAQLLGRAPGPAAAAAEITERDRGLAPLRVVTCHLGAGESVAAVQGGVSVDTSMGFTPLEGLVMATRSGNVDPGLLVWLLRHGLGLDELSRGLEQSAGLAGLASLPGGSGDLREVRAAADTGSASARLAVEVHAHRLRQAIAAMAAAMDGLDALVFTGGIGEHQPRVRSEAAAGLSFLGVAVNPGRNERARGGDSGNDTDISADSAPVRTLMITAREDIEIARQVRAVLSG